MEYIIKPSDFDSQNIYAYILSTRTTNLCPSYTKVVICFGGKICVRVNDVFGKVKKKQHLISNVLINSNLISIT